MENAAMQTNGLPVVSGIHKLSLGKRTYRLTLTQQGNPMSKTASIAFAPSSLSFGRLFAAIDRLLLAYAEMTIRNGDTPRCNV